jgi:hypothetical protein
MHYQAYHVQQQERQPHMEKYCDQMLNQQGLRSAPSEKDPLALGYLMFD